MISVFRGVSGLRPLLWPAVVAFSIAAGPAWSQSQEQCGDGGSEGGGVNPKAVLTGSFVSLLETNKYRIDVTWPRADFADGTQCSSTNWHFPELTVGDGSDCYVDPEAGHAIVGTNSGGSLEVDVTRISSGDPSCVYVSPGKYTASLRAEDDLSVAVYTRCSPQNNQSFNTGDACLSEIASLVPDSAPGFPSGTTIDDGSWRRNEAIETVTLPEASGGDAPLTYSLSPDLPTGLSFDADARTISGTPTVAQASITYAYTVTDADGDAESLTFAIVVRNAPAFAPGTTVSDRTWKQNEAIETVTLPEASGGDAPLAYTLTPALPTGLTFDPDARTISGTPTVTKPSTPYTYTVTDADGDAGSLTFAIAVVDSQDARRQMRDTLADIARSSLGSASDVVRDRFDATSDATVQVAGFRVESVSLESGDLVPPSGELEGRRLDADALLAGSAVLLPLEGQGDSPSAWTIWSRGDLRRFEGGRQGASQDGSLVSGWLGVDTRTGDGLLAGAALSRSRTETDWRSAADAGKVETSLDSVYGYMQQRLAQNRSLYGAIGIGRGEMERSSDSQNGVTSADLEMLLALAGGSWPVARTDGLALSVTGDAGWARMETDDDGSGSVIAGLDVEIWRLRAGLEAVHEGVMLADAESGHRLTPRFSLAFLKDGGDGQTGTGLEAAVRLAIASPDSRIGMDLSGNWLVLHSDDRRREWGAGLQATLRPDVGGRGLSLSLGPRWGVSAGTLDALGSGDAFPGTDARADRASMAARAAWGAGVEGGGLLTPFLELDLNGGETGRRRYSAGAELGLPEPRVRARLAADWLDNATGGGEFSVGARLNWHF